MTTNTTSPALYIKNGVLMTPHGECASAPASAILAMVASQSARIAELEAALAGMCDDADATYRGIAHGSTAPISLGQFGRLATALALLPKLEAR